MPPDPYREIEPNSIVSLAANVVEITMPGWIERLWRCAEAVSVPPFAAPEGVHVVCLRCAAQTGNPGYFEAYRSVHGMAPHESILPARRCAHPEREWMPMFAVGKGEKKLVLPVAVCEPCRAKLTFADFSGYYRLFVSPNIPGTLVWMKAEQVATKFEPVPIPQVLPKGRG